MSIKYRYKYLQRFYDRHCIIIMYSTIGSKSSSREYTDRLDAILQSAISIQNCVESQWRREKPELSTDLDRGLGKECSISPSQNIWRGTESSSTRVRRSLTIALFSHPIFLRPFSSPLPSSSLQVWEDRPRPVERVTGGGYLRLWFSADSQEKREERKEEGDTEKGNRKSKRKMTATTDQ